ncbi:hypothetical protein [Nocardia cyriacigeorgica]|uniref:hypothetical protein n=1 Tax=Nocardia cyriacigeorgica TaxID=135487 RepID=UPI0024584F3D|nr:hypothetical protein [Nocardia cyriacigeorgica]
MSAQLVYFQVPQHPPGPCRAFAELRSAVPPPVSAAAHCLVGEVAQFDECEDDVDEATQVPVRYRGRVMAAPLHAIRPVL